MIHKSSGFLWAATSLAEKVLDMVIRDGTNSRECYNVYYDELEGDEPEERLQVGRRKRVFEETQRDVHM